MKSALFIVLLLFIAFSQIFLDISSYFSQDRIYEWIAGFGVAAPLFYVVIMSLAVIISPVPSLPMDLAAGAFFGPLLGTVYSVIGASTGAVISFMISRFLGRNLIERFLGGHINFCTQCSDRILTKIVFFSRMLPFISFDIVSYGAGLTKMSLMNFIISTFFGTIPLTFIYNYFGSVFIFSGKLSLMLGIVFVAFFFLIPRFLEKKGIIKALSHRG
jgi:uncharacterized membrane protein YdjX (TVP38/TMEM64 family)